MISLYPVYCISHLTRKWCRLDRDAPLPTALLLSVRQPPSAPARCSRCWWCWCRWWAGCCTPSSTASRHRPPTPPTRVSTGRGRVLVSHSHSHSHTPSSTVSHHRQPTPPTRVSCGCITLTLRRLRVRSCAHSAVVLDVMVVVVVRRRGAADQVGDLPVPQPDGGVLLTHTGEWNDGRQLACVVQLSRAATTEESLVKCNRPSRH